MSGLQAKARHYSSLPATNFQCLNQLRDRVPLFITKLDLNLRKNLVKCYIWSMVLKLENCIKLIRNSSKILKYCVGEG